VLDDARDLAEVRRHAAAAGLAVTTGGRFHHLIGAQQSKGRAVGLLIKIWREGGGADDVSVSLGDGENDIPMLEQTDVAIRVPAPPRPLPMLNRSDSIVAPAPGPAGWSAALLELFDAPPADAPPVDAPPADPSSADPSPADPSPAPDSAGHAPDSS
jgi:mannosyl-3-phosphoglycerate phosphatase